MEITQSYGLCITRSNRVSPANAQVAERIGAELQPLLT